MTHQFLQDSDREFDERFVYFDGALRKKILTGEHRGLKGANARSIDIKRFLHHRQELAYEEGRRNAWKEAVDEVKQIEMTLERINNGYALQTAILKALQAGSKEG